MLLFSTRITLYTSIIVHREIFEGLMPVLQVAPPRLLVPYNVTSSRLQLYTSTLGLRSATGSKAAIRGFGSFISTVH